MKILFICKNNQFRSQMAAAIYNKITSTNDADSAGTYVGSVEVPDGSNVKQYFRTTDFFEFMEENGMNVRNNRTKKLLPEMIENASVVVSMAEEPFIPGYLRNSKKVLWWKVENPPFATREVTKKTFSQIKSLIDKLNK
ncbi:MAG: hypothetical protein NUV98_04575 [Candidatus Roizmanbacteria bacterium]|nr:hypothetical protein [Candidatus Roizmanbacteria bacterium]